MKATIPPITSLQCEEEEMQPRTTQAVKIKLRTIPSHYILENGDLQIRATNLTTLFNLLTAGNNLKVFCSAQPITIFHYSIFDKNDFNRYYDKVIFGKLKIYHASEKSTHNTQNKREDTYTAQYLIRQITKYLYEETPLFEKERQEQTNYICKTLCHRTKFNSPHCSYCCFNDTRQANGEGKTGKCEEVKKDKMCRLIKPENTYATVKQFYPSVRFPNQRKDFTDLTKRIYRQKGSQTRRIAMKDLGVVSM